MGGDLGRWSMQRLRCFSCLNSGVAVMGGIKYINKFGWQSVVGLWKAANKLG